MARRDGGTPMYRARQIAKIFVTVEQKGEPPRLRVWSGPNCKSIKKAASKHYPGATLSFGRCFWVTL
jgi:hypothetical protein